MSLTEIVDLLAQEALLLDSGNLKACGKMLSLLDMLNHPDVHRETAALREYLEAMIMNEIDGGGPDINLVIGTVETIQHRLQGVFSGEPGRADESGEADEFPPGTGPRSRVRSLHRSGCARSRLHPDHGRGHRAAQ